MQRFAKSSERRAPKQERAAARRDALLNAAAELFAEKGYGSVTMTQIAERAGASIGTLYEYFPNKVVLTRGLANKYTQEADLHWAVLLKGVEAATSVDLAQIIVEGMLTFVKSHPGYPALLAAPIKFARSERERRSLRLLFATALRSARPAMSKEQSILSSRIVVELLKALIAVQAQVAAAEHEFVTSRFRDLVAMHIDRS